MTYTRTIITTLALTFILTCAPSYGGTGAVSSGHSAGRSYGPTYEVRGSGGTTIHVNQGVHTLADVFRYVVPRKHNHAVKQPRVISTKELPVPSKDASALRVLGLIP